jgi:hypothetical protein
MQITEAKWVEISGLGRMISAVIDGVQMWIPTELKNRHYAALIKQGITIADSD